MGLLIRVDSAAKLGILDDLEFFHALFALLCGSREVGELGCNAGSVLFEALESGVGGGRIRWICSWGEMSWWMAIASMVWSSSVSLSSAARSSRAGREGEVQAHPERLESTLDPA